MRQIDQTRSSQGRTDIFLCINKCNRYYNKVSLKELAPPTIFTTVSQPLPSLGLLIIGLSRSHSDTALSRTPLEERSARRRDLYPKTRTIHTKQTYKPLRRSEHKIPVSEQPDIHALGCAATEIDSLPHYVIISVIGIK